MITPSGRSCFFVLLEMCAYVLENNRSYYDGSHLTGECRRNNTG